jgi:hypothetical protein
MQKDRQAIKKVIRLSQTFHGMDKISSRAWAEYFEMERKIIRQKFVIRLYHTLLLGILTGLIFDKLL